MLCRVQVRAADPATQRLDQHLPGRRYRIGDAVDHDLTLAENGSAHGMLQGSVALARTVSL
jgi:hypothetical protein